MTEGHPDKVADQISDAIVDAALAADPQSRVAVGVITALARTLSGGEQQMVVLAQALISQPRYLLIDELSLGLAPVVVSRLIPVIAAVAESGTGVLLIEQFATVALGLAHRAYIMEGGRIRFSGLASELRAHPELLSSAYLLRGSSP